MMQGWIPACAESTPRMGKKCSGGGMTDDGGWQEATVAIFYGGEYEILTAGSIIAVVFRQAIDVTAALVRTTRD